MAKKCVKDLEINEQAKVLRGVLIKVADRWWLNKQVFVLNGPASAITTTITRTSQGVSCSKDELPVILTHRVLPTINEYYFEVTVI